MQFTRAAGKALRKTVALGGHDLTLPPHRDPVGILAEQNATRIQSLVPVRMGRMLESPFAFYRGSAAVMAADLKAAPVTGLEVVACGDAHVSNFGFYGSPDRDLVFDVNDFDEAAVAPWEWDVHRLTTSVELIGRANGLTADQRRSATTQAVAAYRDGVDQARRLTATQRYYARVDTSDIAQRIGKKSQARLAHLETKARNRTSEQLMHKVTTRLQDGALRLVDQPPVLQHVEHAHLDELGDLFETYRATVREDVAYLLGQFHLDDYALRIVGVGSVGTRCYLLALRGPTGDAFFLQAKEAAQSVLVTYGGRRLAIPGREAPRDPSQGHRVVAAQRILQATSDPFLGWNTAPAIPDNPARQRPVDFYWRQFRDMKGSVDPTKLDAKELGSYGGLCAALLARAHAQSPSIPAIAGYLGSSQEYPAGVARWAAAYADVVEADYAALGQAVKDGRMPCESGV